MANSLDKTILADGWRNAIVRFAGALDASDASIAPAVRPAEFQNNETLCTLTGFRVDKVQFTIASGLSVILEWNGASPELIGSFTDTGELEWKNAGGLQPDPLRAGYDGSINLRTVGFVPGQLVGYTVTLFLVKLYSR